MTHQKLFKTFGYVFHKVINKRLIGRGTIATATAISTLLASLSLQAIAETPNQIHRTTMQRMQLAPNLLKESNRAQDLGEPLFPEYYKSPFSWWRTGSDEPAPFGAILPPGSSEDIMEVRSSSGVAIEAFPELSPYPVLRPFELPASDRINILQSQ